MELLCYTWVQPRSTFSVPHDGAVETVVLQSSTTWHDFRHTIAEKIDVATKHLSLSYRLNSQPQKAPFRHLSTTVHYLELVDSVNEELESRAAKSSKATGKMKALVVELKDLRPADRKGKGKAKGKKGKKTADERYRNRVSLDKVSFLSRCPSPYEGLFSLTMTTTRVPMTKMLPNRR